MNEAVQKAKAAAEVAVQTAVSAAQNGTTTAQTGYELTQTMLKESEAPLVIPLLILTSTAISEGLAAYTATVNSAKMIGQQVETAMAAAEAQVQQHLTQAKRSLE
ncbi:hypothetical protein MNBD_CHLOROFLEXI01-658 [hydrothermal vent metagenome]|uniref:Uncharacterized protein n=1 Tax=hydrothermal vent metagenome TaxID=652676 RepID=A0A3B0VH17_9ZZZZ